MEEIVYKLNQLDQDLYIDAISLMDELLPILGTSNYQKEFFLPGIGLSNLPISLYQNGFHNITCVDNDEKKQFKIKQNLLPILKAIDFVLMDVSDMNSIIPNDSFDFIIDKALIDYLICQDIHKMNAAIKEYYRVLNPNGTLIIISHGVEKSRLPYFSKIFGNKYEVKQIFGSYYMYIFRK